MILVLCAAVLTPRTPQPLSYHQFADQRGWLGIPNVGDVVSNAGFAIVGAWGLAALLGQRERVTFVDPRERRAYVIVFAGMALVAVGSSYYHWAPDNARLVWDRLPMTVVFMALVAAMIAERVSVRAGLVLLPVLLLMGIASVVQWNVSEMQGAGDLRFYAAVQIYAVLVLVVVLLLPPLHARWRPRRRGWALCAGEVAGDGRSRDFPSWPCNQRTHPETFGRRRRLVDSEDARKAQARTVVVGEAARWDR